MMRREFLVKASIVAGATTIPPADAGSISVPRDDCEFHAHALAAALMKKHGARYKVTIDCLNEFVLVHREAAPA